MNIRLPAFVAVAWILIGIITAPPAFAIEPPTTKTNVLFIAADDLRCDLGCYGHPIAKTPNLDRLANRGIVFNAAYCAQAVCNPSRSSVMTGKRPDTLRLYNLTKHFRDEIPDIVTLPQHFKQHGYHTENIGKIYHNWRTEIQGDPRSWSTPAMLHFGTHDSDQPKADPMPKNQVTAPRCECLDVADEAYFDGRIAKQAVTRIAHLAEQEQPFFLAVGFWKPHLPFNAPKRYWDLYAPATIPEPAFPHWPAGTDQIAWHNSRELLRANKGKSLSAMQANQVRHGYLAGISYLDAQVGKLMDALEQHDLADNTLVVFWSDHGFHLGDHTLWCKTSNFELDARVPLIIMPPGGTQGRTNDSVVELLDLYPTLAEACKLPQPDGLAGTSLLPIIQDQTDHVKLAALTQHPRPPYYKPGEMESMGYSVRTQRYRYTQWQSPDRRRILAEELYDHQVDPHESKNVVSANEHQAALETLRTHLQQLTK
ncbi:Arylsulfatase [Stieleria bergensis]|uniref:Arylsulfatase n=1 Tax=Stieleria bergensis TaxID=2528025 RepID=A0A517SZR6_9BACT|nr:Arylsulfatase [Planctomycetes bacterium SV_7m_r]